MKQRSLKRWFIWGALLLTLLACLLPVDRNNNEVPHSNRPRLSVIDPVDGGSKAASTPPGRPAPVSTVASLKPRDEGAYSELHLFSPPTPLDVPPAPPVALFPTPAPVPNISGAPQQPPPFPIRVLGQMVDGDEISVFLQYQDQNLVAKEGDLIDQTYRIEKIQKSSLSLRNIASDDLQTINWVNQNQPSN